MKFGPRCLGLPPPPLRYGSELDNVMTRSSTQNGTPTAIARASPTVRTLAGRGVTGDFDGGGKA
jgi:hypothetical protein